MNTLLIEKQTGGYFKFTLNGDTANAITSIQNDLLAVGTQLHFKTGNGANIIKEQFIYPADVTIVAGGTFTFTTVAQVWDKLIDIDYFAWLGGGGGGGVDRFDDLLDTFQYTGNAGKAVVVDNSELRLVPITLYNKRLFTELEDTPSSLVPNKMLVVNPTGTAVVLQDQPEQPEQLLNSVGYFDYNDLATQTIPLNAVANVALKLTNDTEGANTSTDQNPYGVSYVWDYTTNAFNFSELEVGDTIDVRIHVQVTTTSANQKVSMSAKFGIGSVSEFTNSIYENVFKSSGTHEVSFVAPFYMGSTYITDYPAELYLTSDATATVKVDGWYVRILRKNINIITVDYTVPDATTTVKGIVRLAGDLAGTANNPTVPELANKVPTSRTVSTTSPLFGGGDLSSDLTLFIQQSNSVASGYLTYADWRRFDDAHNDRIVSAAVTGTTTKTLTLNQHDGGFIQANWTDDNTGVWGTITGNLPDQEDLQDALDLKANDNEVVHLAGSETITGQKRFTNSTIGNSSIRVDNSTIGLGFGIYSDNSASTGVGVYSLNNAGTGIYSNNYGVGTGIYSGNSSTGFGIRSENSSTGRGIQSNNTSTGFGFYSQNASTGKGIYSENGAAGIGIDSVNSSTGTGIRSVNSGAGKGIESSNISTGIGIYSSNTSTGTALYLNNESSGKNLVLDNSTAATGMPFTISKNGVDKFTINDAGEATGVKFIKSGGTSSQFLKADGSVDSTNYSPLISQLEFNNTDKTVWNNGKGNVSSNTSFGEGALKSNTTGVDNTGFGYYSLSTNTTGSGNVAMGIYAGWDLQTNNNISGTPSGSNSAPVANDDVRFTAINTPTSGNLLTNDYDVDGNTLSITQFVINGTTYAGGSISDIPSVGTIIINTNGTFTFSPNLGYSGAVPIVTYTISDGAGGTDAGVLSIFVVNDYSISVSNNSVFLGTGSRPLANNQNNQIVIGYNAVGSGSDTVTIGNNSITTTRLKGEVQGNSFKKDGGTSSQFLKADGSVDSNVYALDSAVVKLTGDQTVAGVKTFSSDVKSTAFRLTGGTSGTGLYYGHTNKVVLANYTVGGGIDFETNGGNINMVLDSSGNLGIGTTSPTSKLHIYTNAWDSSQPFASIINLDGNAVDGKGLFVQAGADNSTSYIANFSTYSGNSALYVTGNGNVGIGTTSPQSKLSVSTTGNNIGISIGDSGNTSGKNLDLGYFITADYGYIQAIHNGVGFKNIAINPNGGNVGIGTTSPTEKLSVSGGNISLGAGYKLQYSSTAYITPENNVSGAEIATGGILTIKTGGTTERVRVDASGNVGIGTTSPDNGKLTILKATSRATESSYGIAIQSNVNNAYTELLLGADDSVDCGIIQTAAKNTNFTGKKLALQPQGGNVGIGTTSPSYTLHVNGSVAGTSAYVNLSDKRYKKDILPIENALDKILALNGVTFNWDKESTDMNLDDNNHIGLIAQDVEQIIPQAVVTASDENETKSVAYTDLVPVLIEAIKELKAEIEILKNK